MGTVFQPHGAPLHFPSRFRAFLGREFPDRWIGRRPIPWAPRFPDVTPPDFFLWGFVKDTAYRDEVQNVNGLGDRIVSAAECVTNEMLVSTWPDTEYRLDNVSCY
jgi:hypothetical protein